MKLLVFLFALLMGGGVAHAQVANVNCQKPTRITLTGTTMAGLTQVIAAPTNANIAICAYTVQVAETTANAFFGLSTGTGTNCGTGTAVFRIGFGTAGSAPSIGATYDADAAPLLPAANAVCLRLDSAVGTSVVTIDYALSMGY